MNILKAHIIPFAFGNFPILLQNKSRS